MHLEFSGQHVNVGEDVRAFAEKKLSRIEKHFKHITNVHVFFKKQGFDYEVEATVHASASDEIFADASGSSMEMAINELVQKLDRQIIRHKEKLKNHRVR